MMKWDCVTKMDGLVLFNALRAVRFSVADAIAGILEFVCNCIVVRVNCD